jgi:hypothetical protein
MERTNMNNKLTTNKQYSRAIITARVQGDKQSKTEQKCTNIDRTEQAATKNDT